MNIKNWIYGALLSTSMALTPKVTQANNLENVLKPKIENIEKKENKIVKKENTYSKKLEKIVKSPKKVTKYNTEWWELLLYIPAAYLSTVLVHETGHIVTTKAMGYKDVKLHGPTSDTVMSVSYKYPFKGYTPSKIEENIISAAGVAFTTMGNITLTSLLKNQKIPKKIQPFIATTSLMMMADRWRYIFSTTLKFGFRKEIMPNDDIHSIVKSRFKSRKNQAIAYGILTGVTALEIGLRHSEIKYLFNTMLGKETNYKENNIYLMATPSEFGSGGSVLLKGSF